MANFIMMYNGSCPGGWSNYTGLNGKYPKLAASYGGSGSDTTHTHDATLSNTTLTDSGNDQGRQRFIGPAALSVSGNHTHTVSFASVTTGSGTLEPKHTTLVFCYVTE